MTAQRCLARRLVLFASSPEAQVRRGHGWIAVVTGVDSNDYNGVVAGAATDVEAAEALSLMEWFADLEVPACWLSEAPDKELTAMLLEAGAQPERSGWWAGRDLDDDIKSSETGPTIRRVRSAADLGLWLDVAAACGWVENSKDREARRQLYAGVGLDSDVFAHWIAAIDNQPVGIASAFLDGGAVDLYGLAVVENQRRRGVGRALVEHRLHWASHASATRAVSALSPSGWQLYSPLGLCSVPVDLDVCFYLPDHRRTAV